MSVAYRRSYFMLDLLTGALLLCIAVECASKATFGPENGMTSMVVALLTLAVTFSFLVVRALLLWGHLSAAERKLASPAIFQVMGFHGLGILLSLTAVTLLWAGNEVASKPVLLCSLAAVFGAAVYLSFFWIFRLRVRLELREPHSTSTPAQMSAE